MKSRVVLNIVLFFTISFFSFSITVFAISLLLDGKPSGQHLSVHRNKRSKKLPEIKILNYGRGKESIAASNVFNPSDREILFVERVANMSAVRKDEKDIKQTLSTFLENPEECPRLDKYVLSGTAFAEPYEDSSATVIEGRKRQRRRRGKNQETKVLSIGDELKEGIHLVAVRRNIAFFENNSKIECLGDVIGKKGKKKKKKTAKVSRKKTSSRNSTDFDVRNLGDNRYAIKRKDLMKATTSLTSLAKQARIVPSRKHNGFKIYRIKSSSIYRKIGLKNGDIIQSINGISLSSPDKALMAYQRLRNADRLDLDIVRRGKKETLEYVVE